MIDWRLSTRHGFVLLAAMFAVAVGSLTTAAQASAAPARAEIQGGALWVSGNGSNNSLRIGGQISGPPAHPIEVLSETTTNLAPGNGCVALSSQRVACLPVDTVVMAGGDGADNLYNGLAGLKAHIFGEDGNDLALSSAGPARIDGGPGKDLIGGGVGQTTMLAPFWINDLKGGSGNDTIEGTALPDAIDGGPGNDTIHAYAGNDLINSFDGEKDKQVGCGLDNDFFKSDPIDVLNACEVALP